MTYFKDVEFGSQIIFGMSQSQLQVVQNRHKHFRKLLCPITDEQV